MSSIVRTGGSNIDRSADLRGLSTDIKPTKAQGDYIPHGSTWYNMDDCTKYMYNEDNDTWYNIPNGGGGTGDMQKSVYDPTNTVANAGGIDTYVGDEINIAKSEIITEVEGNIATTANNLINDTVGWTNKNLLPITLDQLQAINTSGTWEDNVYTYRGITITVDIFNNLITGISVNGANTAGSVVFKLTDNFVYQLLSEDKYYISDGVDTTAIVSGSAYISVERKKGESGESHYLSTNNEERSTKFTVDYSIYDYYFVNIYIPNNSSINNAVFYPMIRRASINDDTYEPYTKTVKDEIFNLNSSVGNLKSRVGIAEGNIQTLNSIKANKSDLGTASTKNSTSVVTESSDLVESGAVKDIVGWGNKNQYENTVGTYTKNQSTATVNSDDSVTISNTPSTNTRFDFSPFTLKAGKRYILSGCPSGGGENSYWLGLYNDTTPVYIDYGDGTEIEVESDTTLTMAIRVPTTAELPITFYPMVRDANITDPTYEPHHDTIQEMFDSLGTASTKNSTSVVTESSDLVESGAVKDLVGWGNKNLLPTTLKKIQRANTIGTWSGNTYIANGITFTINTDNNGNVISIVASGTASANAELNLVPSNTFYLPKGSYKLSGGASYDARIFYYNGTSYYNSRPEEVNFDVSGNETVARYTITVVNGATVNNAVFKPMIRKAAVTDSTYEPNHASVNDTLRDAEVIEGKNKINYPYSSPSGSYNGITITENKGLVTASGTAQQRAIFYIANGLANYDLLNGDYIASVENLPQNCGIMIEAYNGSSWVKQLAQLTPASLSLNFTVDHNGYDKITSYIYINSGATVNATIKPMIRPATEDATYEPPYTPLKDVVPNKADNSVIAPVENGSTASQAYAVGSHTIRNGAFITWKNAKAQGEPINDASDYTSGDVAGCLLKRDTYSGTTSANGNVILYSGTDRVIVAVYNNASDSLCTVFKGASDIWGRFVTATGEALSNASVNGTYYYYDI